MVYNMLFNYICRYSFQGRADSLQVSDSSKFIFSSSADCTCFCLCIYILSYDWYWGESYSHSGRLFNNTNLVISCINQLLDLNLL